MVYDVIELIIVYCLSWMYLAQVSPKELLNIQAFELQRVLDFDPEFLGEEQEHQHDSSVTSVSCRIKGNVNQTMLSRWISRLIKEDGANLYRYKGILSIKGVEEKFIFQGVGGQSPGSSLAKGAAGQRVRSSSCLPGRDSVT